MNTQIARLTRYMEPDQIIATYIGGGLTREGAITEIMAARLVPWAEAAAIIDRQEK